MLTKATSANVNKMGIDLNNKMDVNFEKFSRIRDCQKDKNEWQKQMEKQKFEFEKLQKKLAKTDKNIDELVGTL